MIGADIGSRLERVGWDADDSGGRLAISLDVEDPQELVVAVPEGWAHPDADGSTLAVTARPGTTTLSFERV